MNQLELDFNGNIPTFKTFSDNQTLGEICYCGKKKPFPKLFYCSLECYKNNIKLLCEINGEKYTKEREATLIKNWDNDVSILEEEKRLNDLWAV